MHDHECCGSEASGRYQESAVIVENRPLHGGYLNLLLRAPRVSAAAVPGQFVHLRLPDEKFLLRRPFSICDARDGLIRIFYKVVGAGTQYLSQLREGAVLDLLGPLGNGFPLPRAGRVPFLIAGGYGAAALFLLAQRCRTPGVVFLGARSQGDIFFQDEYEALGFEVRITTQDGSLGEKGLVTEPFLAELQRLDGGDCAVFACGPTPMLRAVDEIVCTHQVGEAWLSLDERMCCGTGACYTCVIKLRDGDSQMGWRYARTCYEGPVFAAGRVIWEV
ncbi:MAG: dihydroorotate dehydrogenase electron transfer subunit [Lentisphaerae bacterium]|nr:MAG: dihydroorotate dehydrogenase electron transfer subunit [Lentisphaerota bacterium]